MSAWPRGQAELYDAKRDMAPAAVPVRTGDTGTGDPAGEALNGQQFMMSQNPGKGKQGGRPRREGYLTRTRLCSRKNCWT
jgi:hypothetical protein